MTSMYDRHNNPPLWPKDVPRNIEIPEIPLDQMLRNAAQKFPDSIAITYFTSQFTYKKIDELVDRLATALLNMGLKKGETVALHFTNVPNCIVSFYGVIRAGGKVTLLSPLFKKLEITYQLKDSEAKYFIMWDAFDQICEGAVPEGIKVIQSSLSPWFSPDPEKEDLIDSEGNILYLEDILHKTKPDLDLLVKVEKNVDEIINLQYTGGTTGLPKGAMLSHRNLVSNAYQCKAWFPDAVEGGEVTLTALPLYHIYCQTVCMHLGVLIGANLVMVSNPRDTDELLETIVHNKVTIFPGVAALYNNLNNYPGIEKYDLSSIKFCLCGAGALPFEVQVTFEKMTGAVLREGYGLTEASPVTHAVPLSKYGKAKAGTVGFPFPNTECKIVDLETGTKLLGIGEEGEIAVRGPQVMKGYFKRPKESAACLRDGWLYTGDVGVVDEEGYLAIKSRIKNLIKYKGHSVYPAEIEAYMFEHESILDVAVIGIPDPEVGENLKAYVVLKPEYKGKVTDQELINWMKDRVAAYKYPRIIEFIQEMPKSAVGKVLHRLLREGKTDIID